MNAANSIPPTNAHATQSAEKDALAAFRAQHRWAIPDDASAATRHRHPPEDILDRLRERYTPDEVPPCRVCGGELSVQSMGGGRATEYGHSTPDGVRMGDWMDHHRESKWTQYRSGDSEVLALLDFVLGVSIPPVHADGCNAMCDGDEHFLTPEDYGLADRATPPGAAS